MLVIPTFLVTNGDGCISLLHKSSRMNSIEMTNVKNGRILPDFV